MKKKLSLTAFVLSLALVAFVAALPRNSVSAKTNAKELVSTALEQLKDAKSISFYYENIINYSEKDNKPTNYRCANIFSDSTCNFGMYFDKAEQQKAWIGYDIKGKVFRKGYSDSSYQKYDNSSNYDSKRATAKLGLEYLLSHLKSIKLKSSSKDTYVITAKPNWSDPDCKSITIYISKKSGNIISLKCTMATKTYTYLNSTQTFTITGGSYTYSQISYGESTIEIPEELDGQY